MPDIRPIGFTQLGNKGSRDGPYRVNIVFVHGLRGHPRRTWEESREVNGEGDGAAKSRKRKTLRSLFHLKSSTLTADKISDGSATKVFWPDKYLTEDIPEARVWTYGYNADTIGSLFTANNKNSVSQHGRDFAVKIEREIKNNDPIVFVAHSLGGIIVKDAIHRSDACLTRTRFIVFLGTPHQGSATADWGVIASNLARLALQDSNKKILKTLEVNNEVLDNINEQFSIRVYRNNIKIHSFQEGKGISGVKGLHNKVVDDFSSKLGLPDLEKVESIHADHMEMARCSDRKDERYRAVSGVLRQFIRDTLLDGNRIRPQNASNISPIIPRAETQTAAPDERGEARENTLISMAEALRASPQRASESRQDIPESGVMVEKPEDEGDIRIDDAPSPPDELSQYITALGLADLAYSQSESEAKRLSDADSPVNLEWFFENPDFKDWDSSGFTEILQLGGRKGENHRVYALLLQNLLNRGANVIQVSCSSSLGLGQLHVAKQDEQACRVLRLLIVQLMDDDISRLRHAMECPPLARVTKARLATSSSETSMLGHMARVLFYCLAANPGQYMYLLLDGIDILGPAMSRLVEQLGKLHYNLKDLAKTETPVVKIFFNTPPRSPARDLKDYNKAGDSILYIKKDKEMKDCLQTLHVADFDARPGTIRNAEAYTSQWLWGDENYRQWQSALSSKLLLIQGKPGSGKSTLAKHILRQICEETASKSDQASNILQAHFFYSFRGGHLETSHIVMLQSILYQLLRKEPNLFPAFQEQYRAEKQETGPEFTWSITRLISILKSLATFKGKFTAYLILDAIDKSDHKELHQILNTIADICSSTSGRRKLNELTSLSFLMEDMNRPDIDNIVDKELDHITKDVMNDDDTVEATVFDSIKNYIKSHAEGVFLWVDLVLGEVRNLAEEGFSRAQLDQLKTILPPKLMDLYQRITVRLGEDLSRERIEIGQKILTAAAFSFRRFTLEEMGDFIIIPSYKKLEEFEPEAKISDRRLKLLARRISLVCGDLIQIKQPFVQLVHESVREFLLNKDKIAAPFAVDQSGKDEVASVCVRYLSWSFSTQALEEGHVRTEGVSAWSEDDYANFLSLLDDRPLLEYAVSSVPRHLQAANEQGIKNEFQVFLEDAMKCEPSRYFLAEALQPLLAEPLSLPERLAARRFRIKVMVHAAKDGHPKAIKLLVSAGTNVDWADRETGIYPIHAAVEGGREQVVELLLELLPNHHDARDANGETALHKAAARPELQIARALLRMGAYVDPENLVNERPLHLAAAHGHQDMVDLLLQHQAFVDGSDRYGGTPLHRAVANGHIAVAEVLLREASESADAKYTGTPLHLAVDNKNVAMTELLLEYDADPNLQGQYGAAPIHSAASQGLAEIIDLLKEHGADLHSKDRYGLTPAAWAQMNGHEGVIELLRSPDHDEEAYKSGHRGDDALRPVFGC